MTARVQVNRTRATRLNYYVDLVWNAARFDDDSAVFYCKHTSASWCYFLSSLNGPVGANVDKVNKRNMARTKNLSTISKRNEICSDKPNGYVIVLYHIIIIVVALFCFVLFYFDFISFLRQGLKTILYPPTRNQMETKRNDQRNDNGSICSLVAQPCLFVGV